ncbi:MAG: hypothetical protein KJO07_17540, partial [Deltaproteobacteria bacterium]|nr:hypothetical protein [Deltaproteobacteria bacterium]
MIRLPMAGILWAKLADRWWLALILAAAALSDILDGRVARWIRDRRLARGQDPGVIGESQAVGAWLDPLCDKAFAMSAIAYIVVGWQPPLWMAALIVARELVLLPFAIGYRLLPSVNQRFHFDFRASYL